METNSGPGCMYYFGRLTKRPLPNHQFNTVQDGPESRGTRQRPGQCGTVRQYDMDSGLKPRVKDTREDGEGV